MSYLSRTLVSVGSLAFTLTALPFAEAAGPIFQPSFSYTNSNLDLKAFNNAGDVLFMSVEEIAGGDKQSVACIVRNGNLIKLFPAGTANLDFMYATGISQRRDDGGVYVAGTARTKDGVRRAAIWNVSADGSFTFRTLPNIILPEDSLAPGEQPSGDGMAVNRAGVIVGHGASYLATVAIRWDPPYAHATRFLLSTGSSFTEIDEQGMMLADGVEFDHGSVRNRYAAAVVFPGGTPMEVPLLDTTPTLYPNQAVGMRGEWVAGNCVSNPEGTRRAFAWKIGTVSSIDLPNPEEYLNAPSTLAFTVNSSGTVAGSVNGGEGTGRAILWHYSNGAHKAYLFGDLIRSSRGGVYDVEKMLINDAGQVAAEVLDFGRRIVHVYDPLADGIVEISAESGWGDEASGVAQFTLKLSRSAENNGPVTVKYKTEPGTASVDDFKPQEGTLTWGPGDAGEKVIRIPIIDDVQFDPDETFKLVLTEVTGARLGELKEATGYINEPYQMMQVRNQMDTGVGYGVGVLQGESQVYIKLERFGGADGTLTLKDFKTIDISATAGVDFEVPANLSLSWAAGEEGAKSFAIKLLNNDSSNNETKSFMFSGEAIISGSESTFSVSGTVYILPKDKAGAPVINPSEIRNLFDRFSMTMAAVQGSIVQLEKTLQGLTETWTNAEEAKCQDGEVRFEIPIDTNQKQVFYKVKTK